MKVIIQRVTKASVTVGDDLISSIGKGLCLLVGISRHDNVKDLQWMVRKVLNLRVFEDEQEKRWTKSVKDHQLEVLCVSQFTLMSVLKGNKPDYHLAMGGDVCKTFYNQFLEEMRKQHKPELIKDGQFGAYMQVHIQNDGPITIQLDSPPHKETSKSAKDGPNSPKSSVAVVKPTLPTNTHKPKEALVFLQGVQNVLSKEDYEDFTHSLNEAMSKKTSSLKAIWKAMVMLSDHKQLQWDFVAFLPFGYSLDETASHLTLVTEEGETDIAINLTEAQETQDQQTEGAASASIAEFDKAFQAAIRQIEGGRLCGDDPFH